MKKLNLDETEAINGGLIIGNPSDSSTVDQKIGERYTRSCQWCGVPVELASDAPTNGPVLCKDCVERRSPPSIWTEKSKST